MDWHLSQKDAPASGGRGRGEPYVDAVVVEQSGDLGDAAQDDFEVIYALAALLEGHAARVVAEDHDVIQRQRHLPRRA